jgi:hypothetical protein
VSVIRSPNSRLIAAVHLPEDLERGADEREAVALQQQVVDQLLGTRRLDELAERDQERQALADRVPEISLQVAPGIVAAEPGLAGTELAEQGHDLRGDVIGGHLP